MKINIIHILLFLLIICLLYTLLSDCGIKDGFSVGAPDNENCGFWSEECENQNVQSNCPDMCSQLPLSQIVKHMPGITTQQKDQYIGMTKQEIIRNVENNNYDLGTPIYLITGSSIRTSEGDFYLFSNIYYAFYNTDANIYSLVTIIKEEEEEGSTIITISDTAITEDNLNDHFTIRNTSSPTTLSFNDQFNDQINNLQGCDTSFDLQGPMGGHNYYTMGQSDLSGDGRGRCCSEVQDYFNNHMDVISNTDALIQTNFYKYYYGCADAGHFARHIASPDSPSPTNLLNRISCQGIMDDVECYNGGTLESSPTCRCECLPDYYGVNCEKSCHEESPRIRDIIDSLYEPGNRDLLNEQQQIEVNNFLEYCQ